MYNPDVNTFCRGWVGLPPFYTVFAEDFCWTESELLTNLDYIRACSLMVLAGPLSVAGARQRTRASDGFALPVKYLEIRTQFRHQLHHSITYGYSPTQEPLPWGSNIKKSTILVDLSLIIYT